MNRGMILLFYCFIVLTGSVYGAVSSNTSTSFGGDSGNNTPTNTLGDETVFPVDTNMNIDPETGNPLEPENTQDARLPLDPFENENIFNKVKRGDKDSIILVVAVSISIIILIVGVILLIFIFRKNKSGGIVSSSSTLSRVKSVPSNATSPAPVTSPASAPSNASTTSSPSVTSSPVATSSPSASATANAPVTSNAPVTASPVTSSSAPAISPSSAPSSPTATAGVTSPTKSPNNSEISSNTVAVDSAVSQQNTVPKENVESAPISNVTPTSQVTPLATANSSEDHSSLPQESVSSVPLEKQNSVEYVKYYAQNISRDPRARIKYLLEMGKKFRDSGDKAGALQIYSFIFEEYKAVTNHDDSLYNEILNFRKTLN